MGICSGERNINGNRVRNMDAPEPILDLPSPEDNSHFTTKPLPKQNKQKTKGNNNIIKMKFIIDKNDVKKPTKILYSINGRIEGCDLNELNETNTELYINGKQCKYRSYFTPEKEGIYDIQFNIKILMKNCCCLFYGLNLQSLDLSSFNTENVTNMSYMFSKSKIQTLDLSSFNTEKVTNMSFMFYECHNLQNVILTSFNTENVTNMYDMFYCCKNLQNLDLSSFKTQNVTNMGCMFYGCSNLKTLDLSSFNTQNLKKRTNTIKNGYEGNGYMFIGCTKLERVIISLEAPMISDLISDKIFYA